jgi:DNA replication initiation complex subunit (GINS family)
MRFMLLALLLAAASPAAAQHAQPAQHAEHAQETDEAAVMATVERLFGALASKDRAVLLGAVVAEGRATSAGVDAA